MKPTFLRCEYLVNPLGIDVLKPRFSWLVVATERGQKQTAYRVLVASSEQLLREEMGDLWDTGKVASDQTIHMEYQGKDLPSKMLCYWKVQVWDKDNEPSEWSPVAFWSIGLLNPSDWNAKWIGAPRKSLGNLRKVRPKKKKYDPSPLLRKSFKVQGKVKRAILYASALGEYILTINGSRVGDRWLSPEWTDYKKRVQYQTYDVTDLLRPDENVIGAVLADGWFAGNLGPLGFVHDYWGVDRRLIVRLDVELANGEIKEIVSDSSWKIVEDGPIQKADHHMGEDYDARKEIPGWDAPYFDDSEWNPVEVDNKIKTNLVAQMNEPIRKVKELKPIGLMMPKAGVWIFDLGQNIAGWCKIRLNGSLCEPNGVVTVRHGEMLYEDGTLYTANLRFAKATDTFIIASTEEREYHPYFTYHGFRFVEVTGFKQGAKPDLNMLTGCVVSSDCRLTGAFESSNTRLNKLYSNIVWTQIDNLISVPTDCPQRSERMGWMGDVQVYARTSMFNMDMGAFYAKWIQDMRDAQLKDGRYPDIIPYPKWGVNSVLKFYGAPAWTDCGVTLPWDMYLYYMDRTLLQKHYKSAKRLVDYIRAKNPSLIWKKKRGRDYNDWLNGDWIKHMPDYPKSGAEVPREVFATAFFAHSTELLSKMAKVLEKNDDFAFYNSLANKIKETYIREFVNEEGKIKGDTQAGYALSLNFGLIPESLRAKAAKNLVSALEKYDWRLSTGFCTTLRMMRELARWGNADVANNLLFSERFPSWFYMIENGATTMWERWDGYVKGRRKPFQNWLMNSFNHYAYGSIGEYLYGVVLGINLDENEPGFKHTIIKPIPTKQLQWVKGKYESICGVIEVNWEYLGNKLKLTVAIPANASATIHLPTSKTSDVSEGGSLLDRAKGLKVVGIQDNRVVVDAQSGRYDFEVLNL